jgi:hypothetical protein
VALGPPCRSQDPKGTLGTVLSVCGPLVSHVPDGGDSIRTNPVRLWPGLWARYRRVTIDTGTYGAPARRAIRPV